MIIQNSIFQWQVSVESTISDTLSTANIYSHKLIIIVNEDQQR